MKVLQERGDVDTVPGRTLLGTLIFQNLAIIPMILLTPLLIGSGVSSDTSIPLQIAKVKGLSFRGRTGPPDPVATGVMP